MSRFKYNSGDFIGPHNIQLVERTCKIKDRWHGIFICPHCKENFEAAIHDIADGSTQSCGCLANSTKKWNKKFKYNIGDEVGSNHIVLLKRLRKDSKKKWIGLFRCHCGKTFTTRVESVASNNTTSCGCNNSNQSRELGYSNAKNIKGQRFGKLVAISPTESKVGTNIVWLLKCDCGNFTLADTGNLSAGHISSCGCLASKGENLIGKILFENNIEYKQQYCFKKCINPKTKYVLKFDFYLPDYNCCIEYDGQQHFQEVSFFTQSLQENQYRDNIKNQYCKNNGIGLIRIPYWNYNKINKEYLEKLLKDHKGGEVDEF